MAADFSAVFALRCAYQLHRPTMVRGESRPLSYESRTQSKVYSLGFSDTGEGVLTVETLVTSNFLKTVAFWFNDLERSTGRVYRTPWGLLRSVSSALLLPWQGANTFGLLLHPYFLREAKVGKSAGWRALKASV